MNLILSEHLSYCVGVHRTLKMAEELLARSPKQTYYMLGEIVHNEHVISDLKKKGLIFISKIDDIQNPGTVIIQSHGVPRRIFRELKQRKIPFIDATCPMVRLIHRRIAELSTAGYLPVIIGKKGHDEVNGIQGQVDDALVLGSEAEIPEGRLKGIARIGVVVQSTFILEDARKIVSRLKSLVPEVKFINTICRPTTQRQQEVEKRSHEADCVLIIGSRSSANTRHLYHLAQIGNSRVFLIDRPEQVDGVALPPEATVFLASGASTPQYLIEEVIARLKQKERKNKIE